MFTIIAESNWYVSRLHKRENSSIFAGFNIWTCHGNHETLGIPVLCQPVIHDTHHVIHGQIRDNHHGGNLVALADCDHDIDRLALEVIDPCNGASGHDHIHHHSNSFALDLQKKLYFLTVSTKFLSV